AAWRSGLRYHQGRGPLWIQIHPRQRGQGVALGRRHYSPRKYGKHCIKMVTGDLRGSEIRIGWNSAQSDEKQREFFGKLADAAINYLLPTILNTLRQQLDQNKCVQMGSLLLAKDGVMFTTQGWFTSSTILCPWSRVKTEIKNGELVVSDPENSKAIARLALHEVDNAF